MTLWIGNQNPDPLHSLPFNGGSLFPPKCTASPQWSTTKPDFKPFKRYKFGDNSLNSNTKRFFGQDEQWSDGKINGYPAQLSTRPERERPFLRHVNVKSFYLETDSGDKDEAGLAWETCFLSFAMADLRLRWPNKLVPATNVSEPARAHSTAVWRLIPPSTQMR